jgi:hypothetical protein
VPCEEEGAAVGEGAMEVGGESGAGEAADGAAGVEMKEKERAIGKEVMGKEVKLLEQALERVEEEKLKWRERTLQLKALLKEKEKEAKRWAEQQAEVRSVEVQTRRVNYKSVAVGEGAESRALVVAGGVKEGSGSNTGIVESEDRGAKRQPERREEGRGGGKKQVVGGPRDQGMVQHMAALGWEQLPGDMYMVNCKELGMDPLMTTSKEYFRVMGPVVELGVDPLEVRVTKEIMLGLLRERENRNTYRYGQDTYMVEYKD